MKTLFKWLGYVVLVIVGALIIPELPEGVRFVLLFVGGLFFVNQIVESSVKEALFQAKLNEFRELFEDRDKIDQMARKVDHMHRIILKLDRGT